MISDYYKQLGKPEEMETFLETYNQARLNHEEVENLSRPVTSKRLNQ